MVGSGSSQFVGYPGWTVLVDDLRAAVIPELPFPPGLDLLARASFVEKRLEDYPNRIDRRRQYLQHLN